MGLYISTEDAKEIMCRLILRRNDLSDLQGDSISLLDQSSYDLLLKEMHILYELIWRLEQGILPPEQYPERDDIYAFGTPIGPLFPQQEKVASSLSF